MEIFTGYFDYCISEQIVTSGNFAAVAQRLIEFGYRTVAVNQVIADSSLEPKKKKKKGEPRDAIDIVPLPIEVKLIKGCEKLKVLSRLTVVFSQQEFFYRVIKSQNYKKFDIIAIVPASQQAFQYTCISVEADILSFVAESKAPYKINRKTYNQLVERGFHFEILYSPCIQDSTQRKNTISVSHLYHMFGKSKNVIISSGATDKHLLRNPYDIINLGLIFGLNDDQAKNAILNSPRNVYIHAVGRRHGKAIMFAENTNNCKVEEKEAEEMELDEPAQKKCKQ